MTNTTTELTVTGHEAAQVERANASSATPVVFVHGLWLLPSSWDRWVTLFEEAGYVALTPGWPDDPDTVAEAREHPEVFAGKGIGEIADYEEAIIRRLNRKPVTGEPLFQAASANLNPWSEAKVNSSNPERGPMLIVSADSDHTVPWAIANAAYKKQKRNKGVTEIVKMPGRGHALTIDAGWREVAEKTLEFVKRFT